MTHPHDHAIVQALSKDDQRALSDALTATLDALPSGSGALDTALRARFSETALRLAGYCQWVMSIAVYTIGTYCVHFGYGHDQQCDHLPPGEHR